MIEYPLPRFVLAKRLANGKTAFYWSVNKRIRMEGCPIASEPLGTDYVTACGVEGDGGRAAALNARFDEWRQASEGEPIKGLARFGSVSWLFREFKASEAYLERVSERTRPDYERVMQLVEDHVTNKGDRIGDRSVGDHATGGRSAVCADRRRSAWPSPAPGREGDRDVPSSLASCAPTLSRPV
jgi:hypothetical protein